jgi:hypothetical protein
LKMKRSGNFDSHDIHGNIHPMARAADQNASGKAHIVVISSPGQRDVAVAWHEAIRGIEFQPTPYDLTFLAVCPPRRVVPPTLLRREGQERVAGSARCKHVSGADKDHAAGNGGAGSRHRSAFGRDVIYRFVITNHVIFPE